jgi:cytochrome c oxidase assembly factor CtaG
VGVVVAVVVIRAVLWWWAVVVKAPQLEHRKPCTLSHFDDVFVCGLFLSLFCCCFVVLRKVLFRECMCTFVGSPLQAKSQLKPNCQTLANRYAQSATFSAIDEVVRFPKVRRTIQQKTSVIK